MQTKQTCNPLPVEHINMTKVAKKDNIIPESLMEDPLS
jgi:hypothetical protein